MVIAIRLIGVRLVVFLILLSGACPLLADDGQANALLQQGRVEDASALLKESLATQPDDAMAHQLLCRVYYAQEMADSAIQECELAASTGPSMSDNQMWLGRAYGLKAAHTNLFSALSLAKKVCSAFERAVELDPANIHAMSDLGEFYVQAPGLVGGGLDKAQALAAKMQPRFPAQSHRLLALIAEKNGDMATAETELKRAIAVGKTPDGYIDLGHFYRHQNQPDKVLAILQAGIEADRRKDAALVDAATILTAAHLSPQLAESLLRAYLSSSAKSDEAPAFKVHLQLGRLLAQRGDAEGAHQEYAVAVALAPNYAPAHKAIQKS
jgi:tetratricopeptide (TPR) repeat protein